jgi:hypothetical protein
MSVIFYMLIFGLVLYCLMPVLPTNDVPTPIEGSEDLD